MLFRKSNQCTIKTLERNIIHVYLVTVWKSFGRKWFNPAQAVRLNESRGRLLLSEKWGNMWCKVTSSETAATSEDVTGTPFLCKEDLKLEKRNEPQDRPSSGNCVIFHSLTWSFMPQTVVANKRKILSYSKTSSELVWLYSECLRWTQTADNVWGFSACKTCRVTSSPLKPCKATNVSLSPTVIMGSAPKSFWEKHVSDVYFSPKDRLLWCYLTLIFWLECNLITISFPHLLSELYLLCKQQHLRGSEGSGQTVQTISVMHVFVN